jgi:peptidyl-Lys metalloendopeptidase
VHRLALTVALVALMAGGTQASEAASSLRCELRVVGQYSPAPGRPEAGSGPWLEMTLRNPGAKAIRFLNWGTPFEGGWFQPFVQVSLDGATITYGGAMVKRGDPEASDYVLLKSGASRRARLDLAEVFDLSRSGRYRVEPRITLHDVIEGDSPRLRPLSMHQMRSLDCLAVEFVR